MSYKRGVNKLQDEISSILSNNLFEWVNRCGCSGWSKKERIGNNRMTTVISYDEERSILKISTFDDDRVIECWRKEYKGFCDSIEEFEKIIVRLNMDSLLTER